MSSSSASAPSPAPAVRQFSFFDQLAILDHHTPSLGAPEILRQPPLISTIASSPHSNLVLLADLDGAVNVLSVDWDIVRSWNAYGAPGTSEDGRCTHMLILEGRWEGVVVTIGEESRSPYPLLKIWDLGRTPTLPSTQRPVLLREAKLQLSTRSPHPVSALAVSESLSHLVVGLADGTVVCWRNIDTLLESVVEASQGAGAKKNNTQGPVGGLGKLRVLHEGKEPITGLGFQIHSAPTTGASSTVVGGNSTTGSSTTLFILTTSRLLSILLGSGGAKSTPVAAIDDLGSGIGCSTMMEGRDGTRMIVAREEAIYVYGAEGREGCYAYEGPKSSIRCLSSSVSTSTSAHSSPSRSFYLVIVSPPVTASATSISATLRNYARNPANTSDVARVTIFDLDNKFVAHSATFEEGVREVWEAWGAVWVLTNAGKLYRLMEQPLANSLSTLCSRNLYTIAISLAQSRKLPPSEITEIYRRYGDHLYSKSDYEGAMGCYLKTVGVVQASYVIRKFLDAQRLSHLTSYLQELHARGLANSDHTTLLLNCYTKLADDTSLSSFIHSSSLPSTTALPSTLPSLPLPTTTQEPPFDLETAIRVCRQAGYFEHAVWLAERYGEHEEYLRIQIEDRQDFDHALRYLRTLGGKVAEGNLRKYGKTLLDNEKEETTALLIDLCCGTLEKEEEEKKGVKKIGGEKDKGYMSYLSRAIPNSGRDAAGGSASESSPHSTVEPQLLLPLPPAVPRTAVANLRDSESLSPAYHRKSGIYSAYQLDESLGTFSPSSLAIPEDLPSPKQFFAHFVDHPNEFIIFLETIAERRYGKSIVGNPPSNDNSPLPEPRSIKLVDFEDTQARDEQALWNALLELYLSSWSNESDQQRKKVMEGKALEVLHSWERIPYDETQALLVCTTVGFEAGFVHLYEQIGMYDDIVRYWIDSSMSSNTGFNGGSSSSSKVLQSLRRYGEARPYLYKMVLRYLTTSSDLLGRHQEEVVQILVEVDEKKIMPPIEVVQILSTSGTASIGLVREYLKRQLVREKLETDSDRGLINSYRTESAKKQKDLAELSDPNVPRVFQVTRCSSCGGQLDLPSVHFMCRHSYHQRCLPENESQCPSCARSHGVIREIRKNNELFSDRHDLFLADVEDCEDGFAVIAAAYGKGVMGDKA